MGTIAVTGATGYLAEKLIERLITQGHTIHAIARNEGKLIALREKFKGVQIFPCPIEDYLLLKKALNGFVMGYFIWLRLKMSFWQKNIL